MNIKYNVEKDWHFVRETVFVNEQHFQNEFDAIDDYAIHITAYDDHKLIGCARVYPDDEDVTVYHIGRLAILKEFRGKSYGAKIVVELERIAKQKGALYVKLDAQVHAIPFYERQGYVICGKVHMDEHVEHIEMRKSMQ